MVAAWVSSNAASQIGTFAVAISVSDGRASTTTRFQWRVTPPRPAARLALTATLFFQPVRYVELVWRNPASDVAANVAVYRSSNDGPFVSQGLANPAPFPGDPLPDYYRDMALTPRPSPRGRWEFPNRLVLRGANHSADRLAHQVGRPFFSGEKLKLKTGLADEHVDARYHGAVATAGFLD